MAGLLREPSLEDAADRGRVHQQCWVETYEELVPPEFWEHSTEARRIGMWERMLRRREPQRFYRRNGFTPDGIRDARPHQGTDLTAIRMLRPASPVG
ncbi:hypothetical protein [Mycetocola sp.]|uniref:hypothetical protein n=1 Tax=Mycetocola sp. TaxID=1871042 RepID=UPI003989586E